MSSQVRGGNTSVDEPSVQRLLNLTDGVVAIAITLLVLDLKVPATAVIANAHSASDLWHLLMNQKSTYLSYAISFYVVALFWIIHHKTLQRVNAHSAGLAVCNFFFIFAISVIPFSSNVLGRFTRNPLSITIFAINVLLLEVALVAIGVFAWKRHLFAEGMSSQMIFRNHLAAALTSAVLLVSIVVAWIEPRWAIDIWLLAILAPFIADNLAARRFQATPGSPGASPG
jgi:uncharacterized membrane protein